MIAKLILCAPTGRSRTQTQFRAVRVVVEGVCHNRELLLDLIDSPAFLDGTYHTARWHSFVKPAAIRDGHAEKKFIYQAQNCPGWDRRAPRRRRRSPALRANGVFAQQLGGKSPGVPLVRASFAHQRAQAHRGFWRIRARFWSMTRISKPATALNSPIPSEAGVCKGASRRKGSRRYRAVRH